MIQHKQPLKQEQVLMGLTSNDNTGSEAVLTLKDCIQLIND
ncbi:MULTISPECIES: hypothetical protein [Photorhabdus]|nr:hypothetical protein [Photorhabdus thracensis]